jgi:hypothetical protein
MYFPVLATSYGDIARATRKPMDVLFNHLAWSQRCNGSRPPTYGAAGGAVMDMTPGILAMHLDAAKEFLSEEAQFRGVLTALSGACTAFVGTAGTGKTHATRILVTTLMLALGPHRVITACSINLAGQRLPPGCRSLHSLACMGGDDTRTAQQCINAMNATTLKMWKDAKVVVIDEAFRLSGGDPLSPLGKFDVIMRAIRRCDEPYGGLRVVLIGDPIQLMSAGNDDGPPPAHVLLTAQFQGVGFVEVGLSRVFRTACSDGLTDCIEGLLAAIAAGDTQGQLPGTVRAIRLLQARELQAARRYESLFYMSREHAGQYLDHMADEVRLKTELAALLQLSRRPFGSNDSSFAAGPAGPGSTLVGQREACQAGASAQSPNLAPSTFAPALPSVASASATCCGLPAATATPRGNVPLPAAAVPRCRDGSRASAAALDLLRRDVEAARSSAFGSEAVAAAAAVAERSAAAYRRATHLVWSGVEAELLRAADIIRVQRTGNRVFTRRAYTHGKPPSNAKWSRPDVLELYVEMPVRFVAPVVGPDGCTIAVNGTLGYVERATAGSDGQLETVTVRIPQGGSASTTLELTWEAYSKTCPETFDDDSDACRYQFPFVSGVALTISSAQGMEFDDLVLHLSSYAKFLRALGAIYLAITRAKSYKRLWIRSELPISADLIVNNTDARMVRWVLALRARGVPDAATLFSLADTLMFRSVEARRLLWRLSRDQWEVLGRDISAAVRASLHRAREDAVLHDSRALHAAILNKAGVPCDEETGTQRYVDNVTAAKVSACSDSIRQLFAPLIQRSSSAGDDCRLSGSAAVASVATDPVPHDKGDRDGTPKSAAASMRPQRAATLQRLRGATTAAGRAGSGIRIASGNGSSSGDGSGCGGDSDESDWSGSSTSEDSSSRYGGGRAQASIPRRQQPRSKPAASAEGGVIAAVRGVPVAEDSDRSVRLDMTSDEDAAPEVVDEGPPPWSTGNPTESYLWINDDRLSRDDLLAAERIILQRDTQRRLIQRTGWRDSRIIAKTGQSFLLSRNGVERGGQYYGSTYCTAGGAQRLWDGDWLSDEVRWPSSAVCRGFGVHACLYGWVGRGGGGNAARCTCLSSASYFGR